MFTESRHGKLEFLMLLVLCYWFSWFSVQIHLLSYHRAYFERGPFSRPHRVPAQCCCQWKNAFPTKTASRIATAKYKNLLSSSC